MSSSTGILHSRRYKWINIYPPFLGAGIRVRHKQSDDYTIKVQMRLTRLNLNAVGTHFILPEQITDLRAQVEQAGKIEPVFNVDVIDEQGEVVAKVEKRLYVRKKK